MKLIEEKKPEEKKGPYSCYKKTMKLLPWYVPYLCMLDLARCAVRDKILEIVYLLKSHRITKKNFLNYVLYFLAFMWFVTNLIRYGIYTGIVVTLIHVGAAICGLLFVFYILDKLPEE